MKLAFLKKVRVAVSLIFFALVFVIFADFGSFLPEAFSGKVLYVQFLPSLLKFIALLSLTAAGGFLLVLLLTLLLGRVYCSSICPLGTLQDLFTWLSRRFTRNRRKRTRFHRYSPPKNIWRYGILAVTAISLVAGFPTLMSLLDPYSSFGRTVTHFVQPVLLFGNNQLAHFLESQNLFWIYPQIGRPVYWTALIFPLVMLGLVFWLSWNYGRLYCNTLCPVGSLLGLLSKVSWFRIAINQDACNHCGACVHECKSGCIDKKAQLVDYSRCVLCFNCIPACDSNAFVFENNWTRKAGAGVAPGTDLGKRGFMAGSAAALLWLSGFRPRPGVDSLLVQKKAISQARPTEVPVVRENEVTPPGSRSFRHFNQYCTACTLCVTACPTNVLQPTFFEYGLAGMLQPRLDFNSGFCNYDCKICGDVCPTGAILPLGTIEEKQSIQMGKAKFIKENCVVYTDNTDCGACSEHCPTKAVNMVPYEDTGLFIPEVNEDICVGCGACEYPCPTRPYKAIYVEGNAEHLVAEPPVIEELEQEVPFEEEFPF